MTYNVDIAIHKIFSSFNDPFINIYFKNFFIKITELGDSLWYFLFLSLVIVLSVILQKTLPEKYSFLLKKIKFNSIFCFSAILVSGVITQIIKHIVGRARPNYAFVEDNISFDFFNFNSSFHSFPSGHTSTIFVIALILSLYLSKIKYFFILFASLVAFSRIVVGAHFFTDIIGGVVVAFISFKITIFLFDKLLKNYPFANNKLNNNFIFLSLFIFCISAIFLAIGNSFDIYLSNFFYNENQQFILQKDHTITFFFRKLLLPLILLYVLIMPICSFFLRLEKLYFGIKFKTTEVFFIFFSVIFNLIIVINLLLKDMWGRARPNDILQFGGRESFTPWFEFSNACNTNCSFVSGDASVGFALITLFLITTKKIFFWSSLILGLLIGLIRIMEGGHFFSDVIVSGLVVYLLSYIQFYFYQKKYKKNAN